MTWYEPLLDEVEEALEKQLAKLGRGRPGPRQPGAVRGVRAGPGQAGGDRRASTQLAPEHLHIQTRDPDAFADEVDNAGAIFLGPFTPVAVGDYAAGPSHVLPTGGTARFASGLTPTTSASGRASCGSPATACRRSPPDVIFLAKKEGLTGHAASVEQRANDNGPAARPKPKPDKVVAAAPAKK